MADRHGPAARRVQTLFHHVLGGDDDGRGVGPLARVPTAGGMLASGAPAVTPADVPALTRLLDHDNHDMRDAMKRFMKADLFMPVRRLQRARRGPGLPAKCPPRVCVLSAPLAPLPRPDARVPPARSATTCRCAWSASWRWSGCRKSARRSSSRCAPPVARARSQRCERTPKRAAAAAAAVAACLAAPRVRHAAHTRQLARRAGATGSAPRAVARCPTNAAR
jgi:hypothetical protein